MTPGGVNTPLDTTDLSAKTKEWRNPLTDLIGPPPPALRAFATTLAGDRSTITEDFFTPDELNILRNAAEKAFQKVEKHGGVVPKDEYTGNKNEVYMGYGDYGEKDPWSSGTKGVIDALTDPAKSLSFTLGMAKVRREADGSFLITDKYQFDARKSTMEKMHWYQKALAIVQGAAQNGLLGVGNVIGNLVLPEGSPDARKVEIRIPSRP